jgi:hypothetical protein
MRFTLGRIAAGLALAAAVAGSSCLYSTTPPKPSGSGTETVDPNAAVLTGTVQLYDRTDHHLRNMPGWAVRASWYVRGTPPRLDHVDVVVSGGSGVYEVRRSDPDVVAVEIQGRLCGIDLEGMDCCLGDNPCNRPECTSIWTTPVRVDIAPGGRERRTVTVPCDHAP